MKDEAVLEVEGITKYFPGVRALNDVAVEFKKGEVHAIVGENGAGKSTFMKILAGIHQPNEGRIFLRGEEVTIAHPKMAKNMGIGMVHQELRLCPEKTAMENVYMGREPTKKIGLVDWDFLIENTINIFNDLEMEIDPKEKVGNLSIAQQQMVEIARALSLDAEVIIMDEPTSSLTNREQEILFSTIRKLRQRGVCVIYISHKMEEIFEISDRVTVLRNGELVITEEIDELNSDKVVNAMVGESVSFVCHTQANSQKDIILEVENLTRAGVYKNISFEVGRGEIVGMAGLVGAGRSEVARGIFGLDKRDSGSIYIKGKECNIKSPREAMELGLGFVPEDRKIEGIIPGMSVRENITLPLLKRISRSGFINKKVEKEVVEKYANRLTIKMSSKEQQVKNLSGGNQQKLIIGKWLATNPEILILDEPTRGIDVGAKNEIYKLMNKLCAEGIGILMISSELPEVLRMSDRILVMRRGEICARLSCQEADKESIMRYAAFREKTAN